jgi:hypothetical protein
VVGIEIGEVYRVIGDNNRVIIIENQVGDQRNDRLTVINRE